MTQTTKEIADQDADEQYILDELAYAVERNTWFELGGHLSTKLQAMLKSKDAEIERLRGALRTIDSLIPKTKEITDFPYWVAIAGDIAETALNGTWPAYGVMPAPAKETK